MKLSRNVEPISYLKQHTALMDIGEYEQAQESFALLKILSQNKENYLQGNHKAANKGVFRSREPFWDIRVHQNACDLRRASAPTAFSAPTVLRSPD